MPPTQLPSRLTHACPRRAARPRGLTHVASAMVMVAGLVLALEPAPAGAASPGRVVLASHTPAGVATAPLGHSEAQATSADGAFVAFQSNATDVVAGQTDANGPLGRDVFLYELATRAVTLVSHTPARATATGNGASSNASISADGAFVAFQSEATDLVADQSDGGGSADVFLYERATGAVTLVSHTPTSATAAASGVYASISADGASVAFGSKATHLVAGQSDNNNAGDVFVFRRATGAVTLVSHIPASATTTGNRESANAPIGADGAFVTFESDATDLVAGQGDANGGFDVFLFGQDTGTVTLVSHTLSSATTTGNRVSGLATISADGAYVAFGSGATDLVAGQSDANGVDDLFLYERATGAMTLVSHTPASTTTTGNRFGGIASISADGAFVAFESRATDLAAGQIDANDTNDVFLYERATGTVTLVSHTPGGTTTADRFSTRASISADGAFVAFLSSATDVVAGQSDDNRATEVVLYERATRTATLVSHTPGRTTRTANGYSIKAFNDKVMLSADGAVLAFDSIATDMVAGQSDANGDYDVFVFQRTSVRQPPGDFDGDGKTDIAVFRPPTATWYVNNSGGGTTVSAWGASGDVAVPGDYNGDGDTDLATFRPSTGIWSLKVSGGTTVADWGTDGDTAAPGDYDGDGKADPAVFRPSTGTWFISLSNGGTTAVNWGATGDKVAPGDYDGDGKTDLAVFRPSTGSWFIKSSGGGTSATAWGTSGDDPVAGDYDGDGKADLAVFRPSTGTWFIKSSGGGTIATGWGTNGDIAVSGDYNGDGKADIAVFRPSTGTWFIKSSGGATIATNFGTSGDEPVGHPPVT